MGELLGTGCGSVCLEPALSQRLRQCAHPQPLRPPAVVTPFPLHPWCVPLSQVWRLYGSGDSTYVYQLRRFAADVEALRAAAQRPEDQG